MAAKILSSIDPHIEISLGGRTLILSLGLPFSWRIFYFSAVCFSIANLIYTLSCPKIIRNYDSFQTFIDEGKGARDIVIPFVSFIKRESRDNEEKVKPYLQEFKDRFGFGRVGSQHLEQYDVFSKTDISSILSINLLLDLFPGVIYVPNITSTNSDFDYFGIKKSNIRIAFGYVRSLLDKTCTFVRCVCFVLYLFGFLLLLWVLGENFWYVLRLTFWER